MSMDKKKMKKVIQRPIYNGIVYARCARETRADQSKKLPLGYKQSPSGKVLTANDQLAQEISAMFARHYSRVTSEKVKAALRAKKERLAAEQGKQAKAQ